MSNTRFPSNTSEKIAALSYTNTLRRLEKEFADDPKALKILTSFESAHTLEESIENLKRACEEKDGKKGNMLQWLNRISTRILYYERVLDALAQHHAEYVSLVWGSIKFVLIGIANYAELVEEFGHAWVQIGDILHDTKPDVHLHETPRILQIYSDMCSHIMEFLFQAIRWYRRGTASRAIHSIVNPWSLEYKGILGKIRDYSKTINDLSSSQSRYEIRQINKQVRSLQTDYRSFQTVLEDIQLRLAINEGGLDTILKTVTANKSITERVACNIEEIKPSIYLIEAQLQRYADGGNDPNVAFQKAHAATLRRQNCAPSQPPVRVISSLRQWIQSTYQAILILQPSPRGRGIAKDLGVTTIIQLQKARYKVLWVFRQRTTKDDLPEGGVADILRSLIYQIVACDPQTTLDFPRPLHIFQGESTSGCTLKELQDLLCRLLSQFGSCFIIVESQLSRDPQSHIHALRTLEHITQSVNKNSGTLIKVIFIGSSNPSSSISPEDGDEHRMDGPVVVRVHFAQPLPVRLRNVRRRLSGPLIVRADNQGLSGEGD